MCHTGGMSQVDPSSKAVAREFEVPKDLASGHVLKVLKGHLAALRAQRAHPNRTLFYDELLVALLIGAYEPCINSLRTLDDASVSQSFLRSQITSTRLAKSTLSDALA